MLKKSLKTGNYLILEELLKFPGFPNRQTFALKDFVHGVNCLQQIDDIPESILLNVLFHEKVELKLESVSFILK